MFRKLANIVMGVVALALMFFVSACASDSMNDEAVQTAYRPVQQLDRGTDNPGAVNVHEQPSSE